MILLIKISVKSVCGVPGKKPLNFDGDNIVNINTYKFNGKIKQKDLMEVGGVCKKVVKIKTNFGNAYMLKGFFQAVDIKTGNEYRSVKCFLPCDQIALTMESVLKKDSEIMFSYIIGIEPSNNEYGYEYNYRDMVR